MIGVRISDCGRRSTHTTRYTRSRQSRIIVDPLKKYSFRLKFSSTDVLFFRRSRVARPCPADVDECVTPANNCKFACKNLIGSFACICAEGYAQVSSDECRDIDECAENANVCQNGFCENLPGTYRCDCHDGFKPSYDGKQCIGTLRRVRWYGGRGY